MRRYTTTARIAQNFATSVDQCSVQLLALAPVLASAPARYSAYHSVGSANTWDTVSVVAASVGEPGRAGLEWRTGDRSTGWASAWEWGESLARVTALVCARVWARAAW
jgi:hypothetical protein